MDVGEHNTTHANGGSITRRGLLCELGRILLAIPEHAVGQVVEYNLYEPLPLAKRWIGGVGMLGAQVFYSVSLRKGRTAVTGGHRVARGVLIAAPHERRWVIEVDKVLAIAEVSLQPGSREVGPKEAPPWLQLGAVPHTSAPVAWVSTDAMIADIVRPEPGSQGDDADARAQTSSQGI